MERHRIDEDDAFELLLQHARQHNEKVVDVARAVLDSKLLLPPQSNG